MTIEDLFRVTFMRFSGTLSTEMHALVEETLARARGTDLLVIDLREAILDGTVPRFARAERARGPQIRIITSVHGPLVAPGNNQRRVQVLTDIHVGCPGKVAGLLWEEIALDARG